MDEPRRGRQPPTKFVTLPYTETHISENEFGIG